MVKILQWLLDEEDEEEKKWGKFFDGCVSGWVVDGRDGGWSWMVGRDE